MRRLILLFCLVRACPAFATSFMEFYCQSGGDNLNSGTDNTNTARLILANGNWTNASGTFYLSGANLSDVRSNDWASIYTNGAQSTPFVARVIAVDDTADTIIVNTNNRVGPIPVTAGDGSDVGLWTLRIGGAWLGPNTNGTTAGTNWGPIQFVSGTHSTNQLGNTPCINMKNDRIYYITNGIILYSNGPITIQGYSSTVRDGGKWTIDGRAFPSLVTFLTVNGANNTIVDCMIQNASQANCIGISLNGSEWLCRGVIVSNVTRNGFYTAATGTYIGCEAVMCAKGNNGNEGGFSDTSAGTVHWYSSSHGHTNGNNLGFYASALTSYNNCLAYSNGSHGFNFSAATMGNFFHCNVYGNKGSGINLAGTSDTLANIINCTFFANSGLGIASSGSPIRNGHILWNCFGSGDKTNSQGNLSVDLSGIRGGIYEQGSVIYAADETPWTDCTNGNFTLTAGATIKADGYAPFITTVSLPDIGAAQGASTNAGAATSGGTRVSAFVK